MNIQELRKMRDAKSSNMNKIGEAFDKMSNKGYTDDRIWKLSTDKAGNGSAVIRFLPTTVKGDESDELPFVRLYSHGFKNPSNQRWYIENSLTTFNEPDPMSELNSELWAKGDDKSKDIARAQKRKLAYYSNILVISDPKNPDNEGKVFLFKYGTKIMDKIMDKANPTFAEDKQCDVFSPFDGANFKLRQKMVENFPNYDSSVFDEPSELCGGDEEKMVEVLSSQHLLSSLLDRKNFKTYEELSKRVDFVMGRSTKFTQEDSVDDSADVEKEFEQYAKKVADNEKSAVHKVNTDIDDAEAFLMSLGD